ncbi:MAG: 50S ribosomal protein L23 [Candidatus Omnitrophota bacterium]
MSPVRSIYAIIKSPLITEKSAKDAVYRKYAFRVAREANKIDIKRAVEKVYNVKVKETTSMIVKGKTKRMRQNQPGKTVAWKKAIVTLKEGSEIKLT